MTPLDVLSWQNAIQSETTSNGLAYNDSYLRTIATSCRQCSTMPSATTTFPATP